MPHPNGLLPYTPPPPKSPFQTADVGRRVDRWRKWGACRNIRGSAKARTEKKVETTVIRGYQRMGFSNESALVRMTDESYSCLSFCYSSLELGNRGQQLRDDYRLKKKIPHLRVFPLVYSVSVPVSTSEGGYRL